MIEMPFDDCPRCGQRTVELDLRLKSRRCYNPGCDYKELVNVREYHREFSAKPEFEKTLALNGYRQKLPVRP